MLIGNFKNKHPIAYFYLLLWLLVSFLVLFFKTGIIFKSEYSFAINWLKPDLSGITVRTLLILSLLNFFIQVLIIQTVLRKYNLSSDQSLFTAFILITLAAFFPQLIILNPANITFYISIIVINNLIKAYDIENTVQITFFNAFLIGIGSLIYSPLAFLVIVLIFALPFVKKPLAREFAVIIIGFLIPIYIIGFGFYLVNKLPEYMSLLKSSLPTINLTIYKQYDQHFIPLFSIAILFFFAYLKYYFQSTSKSIRLIIFNRILFVYMIINTIMFLFISANKEMVGVYFILPVTVFISNMLFDDNYRKLNQFIFSAMLVLAAWSQWLYYYNK